MTAEFLHRPCPLCGSTDSREAAHSRRRAETLGFADLRSYWSGLTEKPFFSYHRCADCGLLFNPIYFHEAQLAELYANMAPNMHVVADDAIVATQRRYFDRAAKLAPLSGGYLEIGPDAGHVVREAATAGDFDHFWLFEPNLAIWDALRSVTDGKPTTLQPEMEDISIVPDGSVGLAVMIHVLDHMLDPLAMLRQIRAKLAPGGTLMIVTHNEKSLLRKAMGVRWPPFCLQHPEVYNPKTMRALLGKAGFADVAVERSLNYFPIDFLALNAAWAVGLKVDRLPLPSKAIGVRLGNIQTFARVPGDAAHAAPYQIAAE